MTKDSSTAVAVAAVAGTIGLILAVRWNESAVRRAEKENLKQYHELPPGLAMSKDLIAANEERRAVRRAKKELERQAKRVKPVKRELTYGTGYSGTGKNHMLAAQGGGRGRGASGRGRGRGAVGRERVNATEKASHESAVAWVIAAFGEYDQSVEQMRLLEEHFRRGGKAGVGERVSFASRHKEAYDRFMAPIEDNPTEGAGAGAGVGVGVIVPHAAVGTVQTKR